MVVRRSVARLAVRGSGRRAIDDESPKYQLDAGVETKVGYGRAKATNLAAKWRCDDDDAICSQANRGRVVNLCASASVCGPIPCRALRLAGRCRGTWRELGEREKSGDGC